MRRWRDCSIGQSVWLHPCAPQSCGSKSRPGKAPLPETERTRLLQQMANALSGSRFVDVQIIPTTTTRQTADAVALPELRTVAARFQSDALILVTTRSNAYVDWNPLAVSYLTLIPAFFVPGDNLSVLTAAEACILDVRSATFIGCAQGQGTATRSFVTPVGHTARFRALATRAADAALSSIPNDLRRVAQERRTIPAEPLPGGMRYPTRTD